MRSRDENAMATTGSRAPVLVVGSGFLGRHVTASCTANGHQVTLLARAGASMTLPADVRVVVGDANDHDVMRGLLASRPHVVWCAGTLLPASPPGADPAVDLKPLRVTLDVQADIGGAITYFSSGGTVYGDNGAKAVPEDRPLAGWSPYSEAKIAAEEMLASARARGVRSTVLRCGNVYGPAQQPRRSQGVVATALDCVLRQVPLPVYGDGLTVRDYVYVDDVAIVVAATIEDAGFPALVNVGTGHGTTLRELLATIRAVTGQELKEEWHPRRAHDLAGVVLDIRRLRAALPAFRPRSLPDGLAATWAALAGAARVAR